ncbi:MAG TPA: hypothetical protein VK631_08480 [Solirubrobacteraceae bacterium]|nr:hypothetical protein [Solirubrobacteraceae bacterium]
MSLLPVAIVLDDESESTHGGRRIIFVVPSGDAVQLGPLTMVPSEVVWNATISAN